MGFLGGTLLQLIIPVCIVFHFIKNKSPLSTAIAIMWVRQNFFHISHYMKDARSQVLPLVGGGIHDWVFLFGKWGLLQHDQLIGNLMWWIRFLTIFLGIGLGFL